MLCHQNLQMDTAIMGIDKYPVDGNELNYEWWLNNDKFYDNHLKIVYTQVRDH